MNTTEGNKSYFLATIDTEVGQYLVEVFPDGQVHLAQRSERHDTWSPGWWAVGREVPFAEVHQD